MAETETKVKRYERYKDSADEILGEIPEKWGLLKIKNITTIENSGIWGKDFKFKNSICIKIPTTRNLTNEGVWEIEKMNERWVTIEEKNRYLCRLGDIVVVKSSGSADNIISGKAGYIDFAEANKIGFGNFLMRIRAKKIESKFLYYFLISGTTKSRIERMVSATTYPNLKIPEYINSNIPYPSLPEQTAISQFLDDKTTKIGEAISIKEQQISLLKERKQILIHKAVTQGLNSNVRLKDSGVEWIGEIPEHWEVKRLKYVFQILKRIAGELGHKVLSITQKGIKVKDIESGGGQLSMDYSKYQIVNKGDYAMNHMDLLTGYVDISKYEGVISPDYRVFNLMDETCNKAYILLLLQLGYRQKIFYAHGQGVSMLGRWRFPADNFNNFRFPIPPLSEQKEISTYIESASQKIETAISFKQQEIAKLKEYKSSLINSVVTGKVKVC